MQKRNPSPSLDGTGPWKQPKITPGANVPNSIRSSSATEPPVDGSQRSSSAHKAPERTDIASTFPKPSTPAILDPRLRDLWIRRVPTAQMLPDPPPGNRANTSSTEGLSLTEALTNYGNTVSSTAVAEVSSKQAGAELRRATQESQFMKSISASFPYMREIKNKTHDGAQLAHSQESEALKERNAELARQVMAVRNTLRANFVPRDRYEKLEATVNEQKSALDEVLKRLEHVEHSASKDAETAGPLEDLKARVENLGESTMREFMVAKKSEEDRDNLVADQLSNFHNGLSSVQEKLEALRSDLDKLLVEHRQKPHLGTPSHLSQPAEGGAGLEELWKTIDMLKAHVNQLTIRFNNITTEQLASMVLHEMSTRFPELSINRCLNELKDLEGSLRALQGRMQTIEDGQGSMSLEILSTSVEVGKDTPDGLRGQLQRLETKVDKNNNEIKADWFLSASSQTSMSNRLDNLVQGINENIDELRRHLAQVAAAQNLHDEVYRDLDNKPT